MEYFHIICGQKDEETTGIRSDIWSLIHGHLDMYVTKGRWSYKAVNRDDKLFLSCLVFYVFIHLVAEVELHWDCQQSHYSTHWSMHVHFLLIAAGIDAVCADLFSGQLCAILTVWFNSSQHQAPQCCSNPPSPTTLLWDGKRNANNHNTCWHEGWHKDSLIDKAKIMRGSKRK